MMSMVAGENQQQIPLRAWIVCHGNCMMKAMAWSVCMSLEVKVHSGSQLLVGISGGSVRWSLNTH